jgi:circadian clock protein KaiB
MNISSDANPESKSFIFRLFVAGDEPHSKAAKENIRKFCESCISEACEIEIVDVLESYKTAIENNIFLTPALIKVSPAPALTIFGNLSCAQALLEALGLEGIQ